MAEIITLIKKRKQVKSGKPKFIVHDSHKKSKLKKRWRRPKGIQNKVRLNKRGYIRQISKGYKSPAKIRGFDSTGLEQVNISNVEGLADINKNLQGIIISSNVGNKKRLAIIEEAEKQGISILNINDIALFRKTITENIENRKKTRSEKLKKAEKKEKESKDFAKKKEKEKAKEKETPKSLEDIAETEKKEKEKEKKEKDKMLTKKT